ncbi:MAG TPA: TetR/AcrR family transcriptional regulator [Streptosporangiaceae bacterium]|nr:TetR/AcrR family transcriptional regulator [Streptosporangiaceae bacterium]
MTAEANRRAVARDDRPRAQRLLDAAEQIFGERTYRGSTVADVCARAGIATGSFYAHYGSKSELFSAVVLRINADARAAMRAAIEQTDGTQRAVERAAFRAFFDMLSERPWIYRIVRESEFVVPGLFQDYYQSLTRRYARGVRRAQLSGEIDAHYDPEVIAYVYAGLGYTIGMRWAEWTGGGHIPADVLDDLLNVLARGLTPPER